MTQFLKDVANSRDFLCFFVVVLRSDKQYCPAAAELKISGVLRYFDEILDQSLNRYMKGKGPTGEIYLAFFCQASFLNIE